MTSHPLQIPNEPFLKELFQRWQLNPDLIIVRDSRTGYNATIQALLYDVAYLRALILDSLSEDIRRQLETRDVFIPVLAMAGYEFVVAFLAVFSVGAATVPLSPAVMSEEARYFLRLCGATVMLVADEFREKGGEIASVTGVRLVTIQAAGGQGRMELSRTQRLSLDKAGSLLYTSGTTGKPKGVLHTRRAIYDQAKMAREFFGLSTDDLWLNPNPVHWVGGFGMFQASLYSATPIEFSAGVKDAKWFWRRVTDCDVTIIVTAPGVLNNWEAAYQEMITEWTEAEHDAVLTGLRKLRILAAGSMATPSSTKTFWHEALGGRKRLRNHYGMTEALLHVAGELTENAEEFEPNCVGTLMGDVEAKADDNGQILLKSPGMFSRYISEDPSQTANAFTVDGYFKSGDLGKLDGRKLYIFGRASVDVIRFSGWKIMGPELEDVLSKLPRVRTAFVVGVPDGKTGQRVAAVISLQDARHHYDLESLRHQLSANGVRAYQLPTLLRVLGPGEEAPKTTTGKPNKPRIVKELFDVGSVEAGKVEVWNRSTKDEDVKPFDWAGIQT